MPPSVTADRKSGLETLSSPR